MLLIWAVAGGWVALNSWMIQRNRPADVQSLTLATWNVYRLDAGLEPIAAEIARWDADLIALQEVPSDQADALAERLGMHAWYEPRWRWRDGSVGVMILSRAPIGEVTPLTNDDGGSFGVMVDVSDVRFASVHLRPMWPLTPEGLRESAEVRLRQAEQLAALADERTFIAGDFNSTPDSPPHATMAAAFNIDGVVGLTFKRGLLRSRIDYVWLPRGWRGHDGRIVESDLSDHLPLIVEVRRVK